MSDKELKAKEELERRIKLEKDKIAKQAEEKKKIEAKQVGAG